MPRKLYLIPSSISEKDDCLNADYLFGFIKDIRVFFSEDEKSARQLLKKINSRTPLQEFRLLPLNEHTTPDEILEYAKIMAENDTGIISEAGCPCVADPGGQLVLLAHRNAVEVIPLVGPSSILLALMASGLNGQNFAFVGYLPKDHDERIPRIKALEKRSLLEGQTQIVMDTPYRNQHVFDDIIANCEGHTLLCVACDLTGPGQEIKTMPVSAWRSVKPSLKKQPALFLIQQR